MHETPRTRCRQSTFICFKLAFVVRSSFQSRTRYLAQVAGRAWTMCLFRWLVSWRSWSLQWSFEAMGASHFSEKCSTVFTLLCRTRRPSTSCRRATSCAGLVGALAQRLFIAVVNKPCQEGGFRSHLSGRTAAARYSPPQNNEWRTHIQIKRHVLRMSDIDAWTCR